MDERTGCRTAVARDDAAAGIVLVHTGPGEGQGAVAGLCFVRFDPRWRDLMRSVFLAMASFTGSNRMHATFTMPVGQFASAAAWQPFGQKLLPFVDRIPNDPVSYPFALNESEFRNDANALFGGEMENLSASYQPASFYADIAKTAALALIGFAATSAAVSMLPEMVALGAVGAKVIPGAVSALAGGVGGSMLAAAFPTNIGEDLKKAALLPVYRNESLRRRVD